MRTLTLLFALAASTLSVATPAVAQDEPAAEEKDAPKYLLGELDIRVDLPERGWKSDHWSDWDFKATSDDGVVLVAWTTPYQVPVEDANVSEWGPAYLKQAETQGGIEPAVVSAATREVQGRKATDFELSMKIQDTPLVMLASGFEIGGQNFHVAAVTQASRKARAKAELDGVLERLEIKNDPKELAWGGAVKAEGMDATLDGYWRAPLKSEVGGVIELLKGVGVSGLRGCWAAIHPQPAADPDLFVTCTDDKHDFPIIDAYTFGDQEAELRNAWLGGDDVGTPLELSDRTGFWWDTKVGTKKVEVAAVPFSGGLAKSIIFAPKGGEKAAAAAKSTLTGNTFAAPEPPALEESARYYMTYRPTSPVILGPVIGAAVVFLVILVLIFFGLRRSSAQARAEMEEY